MRKFFDKWFKEPEQEVKELPQEVIVEAGPDAIAAPKVVPESTDDLVYRPIDVVLPNQTLPGKFDYHSATWKYLQNHLDARLVDLSRKNENAKLTIERTQLIRGQIKEIRLLLEHTNQLAGVPTSPTKSPLSN